MLDKALKSGEIKNRGEAAKVGFYLVRGCIDLLKGKKCCEKQ